MKKPFRPKHHRVNGILYRIPENFINEGLELSKGLTMFGVPIEQLSRDELLAVAAKGWSLYNKQLSISCHGGAYEMS